MHEEEQLTHLPWRSPSSPKGGRGARRAAHPVRCRRHARRQPTRHHRGPDGGARGAWSAAQTVALAAHGLRPPSRDKALSVVGLSLIEAFAELAGPTGPLESLAEAYKSAWADLRARPGHRDLLFPGAAEIVSALSQRPDTRLGIATGKSRAGVDRILAAQGWEAIFATVQTADSHPSKPHPSMVLAAMAKTATRPDATFVIGDTTYDMAMASAAGATPIGVAWGYHPVAALLTSGAAAIAADFPALPSILDALDGETA